MQVGSVASAKCRSNSIPDPADVHAGYVQGKESEQDPSSNLEGRRGIRRSGRILLWWFQWIVRNSIDRGGNDDPGILLDGGCVCGGSDRIRTEHACGETKNQQVLHGVSQDGVDLFRLTKGIWKKRFCQWIWMKSPYFMVRISTSSFEIAILPEIVIFIYASSWNRWAPKRREVDSL